MKSTTITDAKAALRSQIRALPTPDWAPMLARFQRLAEVRAARTLFLFLGVGREPDTWGIITGLIAEGKTVALPRILPGRQMEARAIQSADDLEGGILSIPAPRVHCPLVPKAQIDLILVPNLCCDRAGFRLGQGGGYYDRYLSDYKGTTIALCPSNLLQAHVPREKTDIPIQIILTEQE